MDTVWCVVTKYGDNRETMNCICRTKEKAEKERDLLLSLNEGHEEYIKLVYGVVHSIEVTEWCVL